MRLRMALFFFLIWPSAAFCHCTGQPAAGLLCGNNAATSGEPDWFSMTSMLDRNFGGPSAQGTVLNRGVSAWASTSTPTLGLNGGTGGSLTLRGSSTGSAIIGVKPAAGSTTFNLPVGNGTVNQVLITDGAGNTSWTTAGSGTVSSVALSLPAIFTVTGSPIVGAGTLTGTLATQSANAVWAGPTTGAASAPTFRALIGADLPNPSSSSLGGVQSFAAVGSQWIRQISTLGVPTASQPAFTDISGTLAAAQCPNPSASTIGCVESYTAVPHQWINAISTIGVPSSTQPNFTDLSGNATLAQLPSISSSSVLGNNSGATSVPSAISASNVLDFIATTQGDVLYRNGSIWTALSPGTNGQVLTSGGAAANPSWTTVTGTGTVTSVATNNGITGGTITTTGTIGLATIATGNALAYTGAGSGVPVATTPSTLLDVIGSTTGNILYRAAGGTGWQVLAPGTNGQVLTMGASTPAWGSAGTLTNVTISSGNGIANTGTCNISTTGTCTVLADPTFWPNHIGGLTLSNDGGTPNSVLDIAAGAATDSTNAVLIKIGAFTKSTAGAWASGTGQNGMGNGLTIANSTWYHVCLTPNGGTSDVWFDTSAACANKPSGVSGTSFRRIGSFKTDSSAHILTFTQTGNSFLWNTAVSEFSSVPGVTTATTITLAGVPTGIAVQAIIIGNCFDASASNSIGLLSSLNQVDVAAASPAITCQGAGSAQASGYNSAPILTNTSAQIRRRVSTTTVLFTGESIGWTDFRGNN